MAGIYIHIPFCKQACSYCNFHFSTSLKYKSKMVDAICKEIQMRKHYLVEKELTSIYFGGGTPSLLDSEDLDYIFSSIEDQYTIAKNAEITLEANPDDLDELKLEILSASAINRLSIGIQSFFDDDLQYFNRAHNNKQAIESITKSLSFGFENLTADLIYGSPTSTKEKIIKNLEILLDFGIHHISTYALTIEEKTALYHYIKKGKEKGPEDKQIIEQYDLIMDYLQKEGFYHYEISNFAKPGHMAVHNTSYWNEIPYLGIGPSAHSFNGNSRQWNVSNNQKYMNQVVEGIIPFKEEILTDTDKYNEYIMTSLRTMWGCNEDKILQFGVDYSTYFQNAISKIDSHLIDKKENSWILTQKGKHFADRVAMDLFL